MGVHKYHRVNITEVEGVVDRVYMTMTLRNTPRKSLSYVHISLRRATELLRGTSS